jgi:light-regulated signal transduction histidine kinase (bacteriophytochrome)
LARNIVTELQRKDPLRKVVIEIEDGLFATGDSPFVTVALMHLLGNAWKYTAKRENAHIKFGQEHNGHGTAFYVQDNGVGFDLAYADKLFAPFQRLHLDSEFQGTGIGLATAHRVITRHGGRIWADAAVDAGATFHFTLGDIR